MFPLLDRQVPHIADEVFKYLNLDDFLAARAVCKEWRDYTEKHAESFCDCKQDERSWTHMLSVISTWKDLKRDFKMSFSGPTPKL